jgi:hypothetical protein
LRFAVQFPPALPQVLLPGHAGKGKNKNRNVTSGEPFIRSETANFAPARRRGRKNRNDTLIKAACPAYLTEAHFSDEFKMA